MTKTRQSYGLQPIEQKLTSLLQPLFQGSKKEFALISNLSKNWSKIVGEKYAHLCHPKSCTFAKNFDEQAGTARRAPTKSGGKLTIAVHNPAIGFFLESNSDLIIERLAVFCGYKLIGKIIIKQEPQLSAEKQEKEIHLNQEQKNFLEAGVKSVENTDLNELLKKIGATIINEKANSNE